MQGIVYARATSDRLIIHVLSDACGQRYNVDTRGLCMCGPICCQRASWTVEPVPEFQLNGDHLASDKIIASPAVTGIETKPTPIESSVKQAQVTCIYSGQEQARKDGASDWWLARIGVEQGQAHA